MGFVDRDKLAGILREKHLSYADFAGILGISYATFSSKMRKLKQFNENEIAKIRNYFGKSIFFKLTCGKIETKK